MLLLQAPFASQGIFDQIINASPVAQGVLVILAGFSIFSWAVILDRLWLFRKAERENGAFLDAFRASHKFSEPRAACEELTTTPLSALFMAGYKDLSGQLEGRRTPPPSGSPVAARRPVNFTSMERSMRRVAHDERRTLERLMLFLATTAAATPFIGLFGTVWGIMNAFRAIGEMGTANLAIVAPGISDALITTAAGLAAAIPAVVAYNHLQARVRRLTGSMEDFGLEFLNVVEKTFGPGDSA